MTPDPTRILRDRLDAAALAADRLDAGRAPGTPRQMVSVYDGGAIPTTVPKVFLTHPASLDAPEAANSAYTAAVDASTTLPVVVLGPGVPKAGDLLVATAVGGRWVAGMKGTTGPASTPCGPCALPHKDLTLSWTNVLIGPGSLTMTYYPPPSGGTEGWLSACYRQMNFLLKCSGTVVDFEARYFINGTCPNGGYQACTYPGTDPFTLTLADYTCSPFHLHFTVDSANCPNLSNDGYTNLYVDE